jgi:hypothetical protein
LINIHVYKHQNFFPSLRIKKFEFIYLEDISRVSLDDVTKQQKDHFLLLFDHIEIKLKDKQESGFVTKKYQGPGP